MQYKMPTWIQGDDGFWHQTPNPSERKSLQGGKEMHMKYFNSRNPEELASMEHKTFSAEVKQFDDANLIVEHFISTENRDRGGDTMRAAGMRINGKVVVLLAHGFSNLGQEPIAKPLKIWPDSFKGSPGICARTQFYDGSHLTPPDNTGRKLYEKSRDGFMPNWSIGYIPLKWEDSKGPHGESFRDVHEWELLEYSPVGVPMNPDCQTAEKCGGLCQKKAWFKVLPETAMIFTKSFDHYRPPPKPPTPEEMGKMKVHLGKNQWCTLGELPGVFERVVTDLIRKEIRHAQGKID